MSTTHDIKEIRKQVVRHLQRFTAEQRANHAASHRLGPRQREAIGEYFYTHPAVPRRAFPTRGTAAAAAAAALTPKPVDPDAADELREGQQVDWNPGGGTWWPGTVLSAIGPGAVRIKMDEDDPIYSGAVLGVQTQHLRPRGEAAETGANCKLRVNS